ncbi:facilitated trehalose transporter Tret1-like [Anticarsia gemmatalis]|uniref:facilitated trehalose transporter Tret1-like n=1 Tax=Anticarsia gemmatalis TaxID=129554 RepID=UPI003F76CE2D
MTTPLIRQTWTTSGVLINMFGQGMALSYPSSLLPALNHPDSPIKINLHASSWLGSIAGVAGIPGFLIASVLMDLYGRRVAHGLTMLPGVAGWLIIYFAQDITTLMIGRFLCGFTSTATVSLGAIVIGEYSCPKYRGVYLYLKNATVCMGAMCMHIISRHLDWRTIALVSLIPPVFALIINYTWPESPAWLVSKYQYEECERSFYWLRGNTAESRKELEDTINCQKARLSKLKIKYSCFEQIMNFFRKFTQKEFLKPFFVMLLATTVLEMSGRHVFPAYALHIMADITGEKTQSFYYALAIDFIMTTSAIFASILVKIMNRRTLLFSTGFAAVGVLMSVCLYLFLASRNILPNDKTWIPISLLVLYFIFANLGCAPIPLTLVGEVFPLAHRGVGSALSGIWISICFGAGLQSTPYLLVSIKAYGFFAVYGSIMGVSLVVLYFIMPETKDRTLQEIENYFNYGKFTNEIVEEEEVNTKMLKDEI